MLLAGGCAFDLHADDADGEDGKADGNGTCTDPRYGDGTCHINLGCGIPDIDCFVLPATDEDARHYLHPSYPTLPLDDPHYAKARAQVDASWALFKQHTPMGR